MLLTSTFNMIEWLNEQPEQKDHQVLLKDYVYKADKVPSMYFYSSEPPSNKTFDDFMMDILHKNCFMSAKTSQEWNNAF